MLDRTVRTCAGLAVVIAVAATVPAASGAGRPAVQTQTPALAGDSGVGPGGSAASAPLAAAPATPVLLTSGASSQNSATYSLGTASFVAGRVYLAFVSVSDGGGETDPTPGVEGAGTSWTRVDAGEATRAAFGLTAYSFVASQDLTDVALSTATLSSVHEGIWFTVLEVGGDVSLEAPIVQYVAARAGPGTGYALSLPDPPAADSGVVAAFAHGADEQSTPGPGWDELAGSDLSLRAPLRAAHVIYDDTAPVNPASSSWLTSKPRRGLVVELRSGSAAPPSSAVTLVAAGDMCGGCGRTALRAREQDPDVVVTAGDLAYNSGLLSEFEQKYGGGTTPETRWGHPSLKSITLPGYGNHDCIDVPAGSGATKSGCEDAVTYFGPDTGFGTDIPGTSGSYWTVRGDWLIVHLNSAGDAGTGVATASELADQQAALEQLLTTDAHTCELVVWHHPRYSSGEHGNNAFVDPWFDTAYANGVDVVISGHDHDYERFAPQDGDANAVADGVEQFVVGTGGAVQRPFGSTQPNSLVRIVDKGVLVMGLGADSYTYEFLDDETAAVDDSGARVCS